MPEPVLHQYSGAYVAEKFFEVTDGEVLDAIRYHTSGRADMTSLEKLVFLSDMLESGRQFDGVEKLRKIFREEGSKIRFPISKNRAEKSIRLRVRPMSF